MGKYASRELWQELESSDESISSPLSVPLARGEDTRSASENVYQPWSKSVERRSERVRRQSARTDVKTKRRDNEHLCLFMACF